MRGQRQGRGRLEDILRIVRVPEVTDEEAGMGFARVVSFEGVDAERMAQLADEVEQGEKPAELPATEMTLLHDPDSDTALAIVFFDTEDDYRKGDAFLSAMPTGNTPGKRASVRKYTVAVRVTA